MVDRALLFKIVVSLFFVGLMLISISCGGKIAETADSIRDAGTVEAAESPKAKRRAALSKFEQNLPADFPLPAENDEVSNRILKDYGAVFLAKNRAVSPPKIIFTSEEECAAWQSQVPILRENFGVNIELQEPAMRALLAARGEARARGLNFTARGTWAARRYFRDTVKLWLSRVEPGLNFWVRRGKLKHSEAARIRALAPMEQVPEVLRLESKGMFFSKGFTKSILYSVTAPGCSQHLSMLAVDINENGSATIRGILAKHGWFQTVLSDAPHFTFLGVAEDDLTALGLKKVAQDNRIYWIPE